MLQDRKETLEQWQKSLYNKQEKSTQKHSATAQKIRRFVSSVGYQLKRLKYAWDTLYNSTQKLSDELKLCNSKKVELKSVYEKHEASLNTFINEVRNADKEEFLAKLKSSLLTKSSAEENLLYEIQKGRGELIELQQWLLNSQGLFYRICNIFSHGVIWLFLFWKSSKLLEEIQGDLTILKLIDLVLENKYNAYKNSIPLSEIKK
jgi:hypothetical protein